MSGNPADVRVSSTSAERWRTLCQALGLSGFSPEYEAVIAGWQSWGRHYHTLEHLQACLAELDAARVLAQRPAEVEIALWYHDAIYRTYRRDNEARCAAWAARFLSEHRADAQVTARVRDLILATAHLGEDMTGDAALIADIDLSVLGQAEPVYDAYERGVRKEYWWVPASAYATARIRILRFFLDRPRIFTYPPFSERYERRARLNLMRALEALNG